jgi:putative transposase
MSLRGAFRVPGVPDMRVKSFWDVSKQAIHRRLWLPNAPTLHRFHPGLYGATSLVHFGESFPADWSVDSETPHDQAHQDMLQRSSDAATKNAAKRREGKPAIGRSISLSHPVTCMKIRLYPNPNQKAILSQWFGAVRFVYDRCLDEFSWSKDLSMTHLRDDMLRVLSNDESHSFLKDVPDKVKAGAVADFINAVRSNQAKVRQRPWTRFEMKYRTKKDKVQSLLIPKDAVDPKLSIFKRTLGPLLGWRDTRCKVQGELCFPVGSDCRLTFDSCGRYFLHVVSGNDDRIRRDEVQAGKKSTVVGESQAQGTLQAKRSVVGLDPGIKTFQTFYSPDGICGKIGKGVARRFEKLRTDLTDLNIRIKAETHNTRRVRMRKAAARMRLRIRNAVDELHWKTARFLCSNFKIILIPEFRVQRMVQGNLNAPSKRSMHDLRHYTFRMRLIHKAREFPETTVVVCSEAFTTKTCSACGKLNNVGNRDVFRCSGRLACGAEEDRDLHGARNVVLRNTYTIGSSTLLP